MQHDQKGGQGTPVQNFQQLLLDTVEDSASYRASGKLSVNQALALSRKLGSSTAGDELLSFMKHD